MTRIIADTGPLVAFLDRRDANHGWAREQFDRISTPVVTAEAVVTEVFFLLNRPGLDPDWMADLIERGIVEVPFRLAEDILPIRKLMLRYRDQPMSLADACVVRMSEVVAESVVFTMDRDFTIYRKNRLRKIPLLSPFDS